MTSVGHVLRFVAESDVEKRFFFFVSFRGVAVFFFAVQQKLGVLFLLGTYACVERTGPRETYTTFRIRAEPWKLRISQRRVFEITFWTKKIVTGLASLPIVVQIVAIF